jgi:hypothetical protein
MGRICGLEHFVHNICSGVSFAQIDLCSMNLISIQSEFIRSIFIRE